MQIPIDLSSFRLERLNGMEKTKNEISVIYTTGSDPGSYSSSVCVCVISG